MAWVIKDILRKDQQIKRVMSDLDIDQKILQHWDDIFGNLAKDLFFGCLKEGILTIETINYLWVNEIDFFKLDILKKIHECIPSIYVKDLKISYQKRTKKAPGVVLNLYKQEKGQSFKSKKTLEELIKLENEKKRKKGMVLCLTCQEVYVEKGSCFFCLNKINSDYAKEID